MRYCIQCGLGAREAAAEACWRCGGERFTAWLHLVAWTVVLTEADRRLLCSLRISPD